MNLKFNVDRMKTKVKGYTVYRTLEGVQEVVGVFPKMVNAEEYAKQLNHMVKQINKQREDQSGQ